MIIFEGDALNVEEPIQNLQVTPRWYHHWYKPIDSLFSFFVLFSLL